MFLPQSKHIVARAAFWRTFHHDGKISPGWWRWGVHAHPHHYIYHNIQSCSVRSSWVGSYTPPISSLPLFVFCGSSNPLAPPLQLAHVQWLDDDISIRSPSRLFHHRAVVTLNFSNLCSDPHHWKEVPIWLWECFCCGGCGGRGTPQTGDGYFLAYSQWWWYFWPSLLTVGVHAHLLSHYLPLPLELRRPMDNNKAECCHLKKFTCKGTLRQVFIFWAPPPP